VGQRAAHELVFTPPEGQYLHHHMRRPGHVEHMRQLFGHDSATSHGAANHRLVADAPQQGRSIGPQEDLPIEPGRHEFVDLGLGVASP
jgi:hypothetical protein